MLTNFISILDGRHDGTTQNQRVYLFSILIYFFCKKRQHKIQILILQTYLSHPEKKLNRISVGAPRDTPPCRTSGVLGICSTVFGMSGILYRNSMTMSWGHLQYARLLPGNGYFRNYPLKLSPLGEREKVDFPLWRNSAWMSNNNFLLSLVDMCVLCV